MQVREILRVKGSTLFTAMPGQPLADAIAAMAEHDVGSLVVMGGLLTLHNLGLFRFQWIAKMWPLLMIAAGVALLRGSLFGSRS